jgi:hypothetical protein
VKVSKVSGLLASARCRFLCEAEIVGALDRHFLCDFEDLVDDIESSKQPALGLSKGSNASLCSSRFMSPAVQSFNR